MKNKVVPIDKETKLTNKTFIVSRTDEKGKVLYANQEFINISGYLENEIIGKPHNFIRHPDMPHAVFKLLWETLKSGKEFNGFVKNLCKDGGFYWVIATITKSITMSGETIYYSVRKKPTDHAIQTISPIYSAMLAAEKDNPNDKSFTESTLILSDEFLPFEITYDQYVLSL